MSNNNSDNPGKANPSCSKEEELLIDTKEYHQRLAEFFQKKDFCDITLIVGGCHFDCHKNILAAWSPYFYSMFIGNYSEKNKSEIELADVKVESFTEILDFAYSRKLHLSKENVCSVFETAHFLQFEKVQDACAAFMTRSPRMEYYFLAQKYSAVDSRIGVFFKAMRSYVLHNFKEAGQDELFKNIPENELKCLLQEDQLTVKSEWDVFEAVQTWLEANPLESDNKIQLLKYVRFHLFSLEEMKRAFNSDVCKDNDVHRYVTSFTYYGMTVHARPLETLGTQSIPRGCRVLVVIGDSYGSDPSPIEAVSEFSVKKLQQIPNPPDLSHMKSVNVHNFLYVLGRARYTSKNCLYRFCPGENVWARLDDMLRPRRKFCVTFTGTSLLLFGGIECERPVREIDRYDIKTGKWTTVSRLMLELNVGAATIEGRVFLLSGSVIYTFNEETGKAKSLLNLTSFENGSFCGLTSDGKQLYVVQTMAIRIVDPVMKTSKKKKVPTATLR